MLDLVVLLAVGNVCGLFLASLLSLPGLVALRKRHGLEKRGALLGAIPLVGVYLFFRDLDRRGVGDRP